MTLTPTPDLSLATPARVGELLAQTVSDLGGIDADSLGQACDFANAVVLVHIGEPELLDLTERQLAVAITVATRVAARIFRNPRDLSSFNYNEVSQSYSDPRLLTPDERMMLDRLNYLGFA